MIKLFARIGMYALIALLVASSGYVIAQHRTVLQAASLFSGVVAHYDRLQNETSLLADQRDQSLFLKAQQRSIRLEQLEAYVIARDVSYERIDSFISTINSSLRKLHEDSSLTISAVDEHGALNIDDTTLLTHQVTLKARVHPHDIFALTNMIDTAGLLTVYDGFTMAQRQELLEIILTEDPGSLQALDAFFAIALTDYAKAPQKHLEQLLVFVQSEQNVFLVQSILNTSALQFAANFLKPHLASRQFVWPVPYLQATSVALVEDGDYLTGTIILETYTQ